MTKQIIINISKSDAYDLLKELNELNEREDGLTNQLWTLREILEDELNPNPELEKLKNQFF